MLTSSQTFSVRQLHHTRGSALVLKTLFLLSRRHALVSADERRARASFRHLFFFSFYESPRFSALLTLPFLSHARTADNTSFQSRK